MLTFSPVAILLLIIGMGLGPLPRVHASDHIRVALSEQSAKHLSLIHI